MRIATLRSSFPAIGFVFAAVAFVGIALIRDAGYGGPHHDEVIGLLASNAKEGLYATAIAQDSAPLNEVVPAARWHAFTHNDGKVSFAEIRHDVMHGDKHPPLAFWMFNRWLSIFAQGSYKQAVWLTIVLVICAAGVVALTVNRITGRTADAFLVFALFLAGNSSVFTAVWVRQYALFVLCYACLVFVSAELARRRIGLLSNGLSLVLLGCACLAGMMTQYTFLTMSLPIHVALLFALARQQAWWRIGCVLATYLLAGALFLWLMPGVFTHASEVSEGQSLRLQMSDAFLGIARMAIPLPSSLPGVLAIIAGIGMLLVPLALAILVLRRESMRRAAAEVSPEGVHELADRPDPRVPLAGMLGAGVLQFLMVFVGLFPGWATGENHMCSYWLLTVFAAVFCLGCIELTHIRLGLVGITFFVLLGMQGLFIWHCHRVLPRVNTSYIQSTVHDLVAIDNLARGFALQITDLVPPDDKVLATDSAELATRLSDGSLTAYPRILYLPMDESVRTGKSIVLDSARRNGWNVEELPVVHTGMYEAYVLSNTGSLVE